jgi:hypothetical protein
VQSVANANGQPKPHGNCHRDSNCHRNRHSHGDCDSDSNGHSHCDRDSDSHRQASPDSETSADTASSSLSGRGKLIVHSAAGIDRSRLRVFAPCRWLDG